MTILRNSKELKFTFDITPQSKLRPRLTRGGNVYTPQKTKDYERALATLLALKLAPGFKPILAPIECEFEFYFKKAKSVPKSRLDHTTRPDLDNLVKAVKDAFNGILWKDDSQIYGLSALKAYGEKECVKLTVTYFEAS
jgi:Holliday junction resolvase RusA-like endonuclease